MIAGLAVAADRPSVISRTVPVGRPRRRYRGPSGGRSGGVDGAARGGAAALVQAVTVLAVL
jgi:hypothetical protein